MIETLDYANIMSRSGYLLFITSKYEKANHWRRKRGGGGGGDVCAPPPTFNPIFIFFTCVICLYNTDKQLFGIFRIPINYLVDNFNKLTQMTVIK